MSEPAVLTFGESMPSQMDENWRISRNLMHMAVNLQWLLDRNLHVNDVCQGFPVKIHTDMII